MRKFCLSLFLLVFLGGMVLAEPTEAANFTLSPASGSYAVGQEFDVIVGITSGTSKVFAADIWGTFDASKLEMKTVVAAFDSATIPLSVVQTDASINNSTGVMKISVQNTQSTSFESVVMNNQPVLRITFRAKATGTASFNFTCSQGSVNDCNIIDADTYEDVITCASNQSGSYTITSSAGGDSSTTTTTTTTTATGDTELPQTGVIEYTLGFGLLALALLVVSAFLFV